MKKFLDRVDIKFNLQIAIAMAISISLAYSLNLKYAAAAGIVTLATVQSTKRETLKIAAKRLVGYIIMVILSVIIFNIIGYNVIAYGVFVLIFGMINSFMGSVEVLSSNAVMATHFLDSASTDLVLISNENYIFVIGVGVGILVNILSPVLYPSFKDKRRELDEYMKGILHILQKRVQFDFEVDGKEVDRQLAYLSDEAEFVRAKSFIAETKAMLYEYSGNRFMDDESYYLEYFDMRSNQLSFLENIWEDSKSLNTPTKEANDIGDFIGLIIREYKEYNGVTNLLDEGDELMKYFRDSQLPKDRKEFENRAILYIIMQDLISMLKLKRGFVHGLSYEIKKKYWMEV